MKNSLCFLFVLSFFSIGFSQTNENSDIEIISHRVLPGQTVRLISLKYFVTPADIYRLNKSAVEGINQGMILQIPLASERAAKYKADTADKSLEKNDIPSSSDNLKQHTVGDAETSSSIAEKYNITITQLTRANSQLLGRNPQSGEILNIPSN